MRVAEGQSVAQRNDSSWKKRVVFDLERNRRQEEAGGQMALAAVKKFRFGGEKDSILYLT